MGDCKMIFFKIYTTIATLLLFVIMACSTKAFSEYKNSSEHLRRQSFTKAFILYFIGAVIYSYTWIISVPLTFIIL